MEFNCEDLRRFRDEGYVIKRGVMNEALMTEARDRLWEFAPPELHRHIPSSWVAPINPYSRNWWPVQKKDGKELSGSGFLSRDGIGLSVGSGGLIGWKNRMLGTVDWMVRLLLTDPSIWGMAEQMLGEGNLAMPDRIRGVACRLPEGPIPSQSLGCHTDGHAFNLGVVGFIDDVPRNGGGFTVWPRSHRVLYPHFLTQYGEGQTEDYAKHLDFLKSQSPVECYGQAGDIVFWHHRLAHAGSPHNKSNVIRQAALGDFERKDLKSRLDAPPCDDMWQDWPGIPDD